MTLTASSNGLMANYTNILNASNYATANSRIVQDTTGGYADDDYVQCVVPSTAMLELGPFQDLAFTGPYKLYIKGYTGTPTSYLDVYLDVYEDDTLVTWTTGGHTSGEIYIETYTPEVWINFDPDKEYRLVVRTGASTSDSLPTVIDYLKLQPLDDNFDATARWEYRGLETVTGGAPTATYTVSTVPAGAYTHKHVEVQVWGYPENSIYSYPTALDSGGVDLSFVAGSGNLPATFYVSVYAVADIELPYIKGNGDV